MLLGPYGRRAALAIGLALATSLPAAAGESGLHGAGSTFAAPLYARWIEAYRKTHPAADIAYDAVGSGEGVSRFVTGTVDFGASDAAPDAAVLAKVDRGALLVPATAGMIVLSYNLPGLGGPLALPRDVYADILLGRITMWDDPRLVAANPGLTLPHRAIALVARQDRSGTTYALTEHLSAISADWRAGPGIGTWVAWPSNPMLARGNEGVAARIKLGEGALGYVEHGFAKRLGLPMARLQNRAGRLVEPVDASAQTALAEALMAPDAGQRLAVPDPASPDAYPIVSYSWLLLYGHYAADKRETLRDFVSWGLSEGQALGGALGYVPLPAPVASRAKAVLSAMK